MTYFLTDLADLDGVRAALDRVLPHPRPTASLVEVSALIDPLFRIEIEAVAFRG
jgi:enamine deaminase RidA (YjgF/YER057c/UK114 family)